MKNLLIDATGSSGWIGGVYHKKNILFSLLQNEWICDNCRITAVTNHEHRELFAEFEDRIRLRTISYKGLREKKLKIAWIMAVSRCDLVFPSVDMRINRKLHARGINWVPDYQHYHYPEFFTESDMGDRKYADIMTVDSGYPLVLSSQACLDDFRRFVSKTKENVYVVPFVSYIKKDVLALSDKYVSDVCEEYGVVPGGYIMTANQFWQHKNHRVIFEAIENTADDMPDDLRFVFTGAVSDYRSDAYAEEMRMYLAKPGISARCVCTGFIDRRKQLALMKGARFLIQPSLFEGWGTVLEDAKVLDKTVLLSDIPVHREQMSDKCELFDPHDADELARKIVYNWEKVSADTDDISRGIERMKISALKYSEGFEALIRETDR